MTTTTTEKQATVRQATVHDLRRMVKLVDRLVGYEAQLGSTTYIRNDEKRKAVIADYLAQALFSHDKEILLIDKSGNVIGIFVLEVNERPPFHEHPRVCNIWIGYAKKNPVFIKRIFSMFEEWAKEKNCTAIIAGVMTQNERVRRLLDRLGYTEKHIVFEKEVGA